MPKKPTSSDADIILKLYDLRRESEMRKARQWTLVQFWPDTVDDYLKIAQSLGTQENNWLRQVTSYWSLASSFVLNGILNEKMFIEVAFSGEMFFMFAKVKPFVKELRQRMQNPHLFVNMEKVILGSKTGREQLAMFEQRVAQRKQAMKQSAAAPR